MISKYSQEERQKCLALCLEDRSDAIRKGTLVHMNFGLIASIAKKYKFSEEYKDDVFGEGVLGLYSAIESYDPARGMFSTYATFKIRDRIVKYLAGTQRHAKGGSFAKVWGKTSSNIPYIKSLSDRV